MRSEPIAFVSTRYRCPHCRRKTYRAKARAVKHAAACFQNPERFSCRTCRHARGPDGMSLACGYTAECDVDELGEYHCPVCGAEVFAGEGGCPEHMDAKPIMHLRVLCPLWEARASDV